MTDPLYPLFVRPEPALAGLTPRQRRALTAIVDYVALFGYPPSLRELGNVIGLSSPSSVKHVLSTLAEKGYLRRVPGRPRALEVLAS